MQDLPPLLPITKKTAKMDFFLRFEEKKKGNLTDETTILEWRKKHLCQVAFLI